MGQGRRPGSRRSSRPAGSLRDQAFLLLLLLLVKLIDTAGSPD
jgi:hypothetical protein